MTTVLVVNHGFGDVLRIGTQNRPDLFKLAIELPEPLYARVAEVPGRIDARGQELVALDEEASRAGLARAFADGLRAAAIVFMHGYRYPAHERRVADIARAPRVERLAFGSYDFQFDTGIQGDGEELLYACSRLVIVSRVAGILPPVDSVTTDLDDPKKLTADVDRARRLGFGAKLCIHPNQIAAVNAGFVPSNAEKAWAKEVLAAVAAAGKGAIRFQGRMIDRPIIERAKRILEHK